MQLPNQQFLLQQNVWDIKENTGMHCSMLQGLSGGHFPVTITAHYISQYDIYHDTQLITQLVYLH